VEPEDARQDPDRPDWTIHRRGPDDQANVAFDHLFERRFAGVTAWVARRAGLSREDAEDASLQAFVIEFTRRSTPPPMAHVFVRYQNRLAFWCACAARRRHRRETRDVEVAGERTSLEVPQAVPAVPFDHSPDDDAAWFALLRWQFAALDDDEVVHVFLRMVKGLTSGQTAAYLRISPDSERTRWARLGRKLLDAYGVELRRRKS
jgi:hypothetical protein